MGVFEAFGVFLGVLLLLDLLALVAWTAYRFIGSLQVGGRIDPAESILRERFARGEIPAGEYEETLEVLRRQPSWGACMSLTASAGEPRKGYEEYVSEAMNRLQQGRETGS